MSEAIGVKSLARAMRVLECFSVTEPELGVSEIAKKLGMQKSTIFNILSTFQQCGYISQNPKTNKYFLGFKFLHLSYIVNSHLSLREIFLPYLMRISEATRHICFFAVCYHQEVHYIEAIYPYTQEPTRNILGERAPMYCTGLGKAMLAFMPPEEADEIINGPLTAYTPFTLTNPDDLRKDLEKTRMNGYSIDNMEHEFGLRCVAVPVFGSNGKVIAAVSVSGLSSAFDPSSIQQCAQTLIEVLRPLQHRVEAVALFA